MGDNWFKKLLYDATHINEKDKFFLKHGLKYCIFISVAILIFSFVFLWLVGYFGIKTFGTFFLIFLVINSLVLGVLLYKALKEVIIYHKKYNLYLYSLIVLGGVILINMIILSIINKKFTWPDVGIPAIIIFLVVPTIVKNELKRKS